MAGGGKHSAAIGLTLAWVVGVAAAAAPSTASAHGSDTIAIASSADGGGALQMLYDFSATVATTPSLSAGGFTLYSSIFPSFDVLTADDPGSGAYRIDDGTEVHLEVVSINGGCPASSAHCISIKLGSTILANPGDSASLGTMPSVGHAHPEWNLTLPDGVSGSFTVALRVVPSGGAYQPSAPSTVTLTNGAATTPTPAPTATPKPATPTPKPATPTPPPAATPTKSPAPTATPAPTRTPRPTATPTPVPPPTSTPVATAPPTATPARTATPVPTAAPTATPTRTPAPSSAPTPTRTPVPTRTPTPTPALPPVATRPELAIPEAAGAGDQLVFYYDARPGFTTFLNLANLRSSPLPVRVRFYGPELGAAFDRDEVLPAEGTRTISLDALVAAGLPQQAGLAVAAGVDAADTPVVTRALAGNFTIANLATSSAWGAAAIARTALVRRGGAMVPAALDAPLDGVAAVLQQIRPDALDLAVFYDPLDLEPVERGGNQVVLASFADAAGDGLGLLPAAQGWRVAATRNTGEPVADRAHATRAVELTHLAAIAGDAVAGSAGHLSLVAEGAVAPNRLAFFVESLGTFATGYLLPAVDPPGAQGSAAAEERDAPSARGDQAVFYYDARDGFTTFLNLANEGEQPVDVDLVLYGPALDAPLRTNVAVAARSSRTIDVSALRDEGLPARLGLAFATGVDASGRPVVTHALAGSFTVANLATRSAWGGPALARAAVRAAAGSFVPAEAGERIDGEDVSLQRLAATRHDVAVYYDPATLEPAELGGNAIVFASFADAIDGAYAAVPAPSTWTFAASRNDGAATSSGEHLVSGVSATHLEALAGAAVAGSAGRLRLEAADSPGASGFALFSESLGTFATGYRLPPVPR